MLVIMGDFNAKVGSNGTERSIVGVHGLGDRNDRGQLLVDFCAANELMVTNTLFRQHPRRLYTWTSPRGSYRNQIDYLLIRKRWRNSVLNAHTYPGADCGTDHESSCILVFL